MTEQTNADLIAENRKWFRLHQSNNYQEEAARRMALILDALEAAEKRADAAREEVGYEKRMREFISGERDRFIDLKRAVEQDRNQLAAVVGKVRDYLEEGKGAYAPDLLDILATDPADALREHDAALIEGLADEALSTLTPGLSDETSGGAVRHWLCEKARQRREEHP